MENNGIKDIFKYYLLQQKVLRKIMQKVFITKKFTQCKTLHTLKIDVFEIPDKIKKWKIVFKISTAFLGSS